MAPASLATATDRIYAAATIASDPSFLCDIISDLLSPAKAVLRVGDPDAGRNDRDSPRRLSAGIFRDGAAQISIDISRSDDSPGFNDSDTRLFAALVPHLCRATRIHREVMQAERRWQQNAELADRLNAAIIILNPLGRILFANRRANELLASGQPFTAEAGCLRTVSVEQQDVLDRAIAQAMAPGNNKPKERPAEALLLPRRDGLKPLLAHLHALTAAPCRLPELTPALAIILTDPERSEPSETILMQLYDLTRAEAATVRALLDGRGLHHAAARLGISRNTAKTHLAHILAKTGATRQTDLVRLIAGGPALVRWD